MNEASFRPARNKGALAPHHFFRFIAFLLAILIFAHATFALEPGAKVYVRQGASDGNWVPGEYVDTRSDCLLLERLRPYPSKTLLLKVPSGIKEVTFKVGDEVNEAFERAPNSKMPPIVDRVVAIEQKCHEVKWASGSSRIYILPGNIFEVSEFNSLPGTRKEYAVGDMVYAREYRLTPEQWSARKVIAQRDDCYETASGKVLSGHYAEDEYAGGSEGQLFTSPAPLERKIRVGDVVDGLSMEMEESLEGAAFSTMEGSVKAVEKEMLILESSNEDCSYDPVKLANIRQAPAPLTMEAFQSLKPGDVVFEMIHPACCCCSPYYLQHRITSQKRSCYLLQKDGGVTEAGIASHLFPVAPQ